MEVFTIVVVVTLYSVQLEMHLDKNCTLYCW